MLFSTPAISKSAVSGFWHALDFRKSTVVYTTALFVKIVAVVVVFVDQFFTSVFFSNLQEWVFPSFCESYKRKVFSCVF